MITAAVVFTALMLGIVYRCYTYEKLYKEYKEAYEKLIDALEASDKEKTYKEYKEACDQLVEYRLLRKE
ncbi:MAG: hypothetical protein LLG13_11080 [Bacteroidales bacterium]|nr:hypothetical protein [Bacteroidales bacterium]